MTYQLHQGDALTVLATLPAASVDCVVTSPPYWGLRSYAGADGQYGLESTYQEYVARLVAVGAELWRVLKPGGVFWLNLGDCYAGSGKGGNPESGKQATNAGSQSVGTLYGKVGESAREAAATNVTRRICAEQGIKPKQLIGIPWRVAFALQEAGWWLRSDVIWAKANPMPESVTDRPTKAHEYLFLLANADRYYFNADAIRTPYAPSSLPQLKTPYDYEASKDFESNGVQNASAIKKRIVDKQRGHSRRHAGFNERWDAMPVEEQRMNGANARTVWFINTEPSPLDHFAVMPRKLARQCVVSACPPGGVVLDPFAGVCTTGVVALEEGRSFVGIEMSSKYHAIGRERLYGVAPLLAAEVSA